MNAWFNINSFEKKAHLEKIDEDGMLESVGLGTWYDGFEKHASLLNILLSAVDQLIQNERNIGVPSQRILLGGFSQGKESLVDGFSLGIEQAA